MRAWAGLALSACAALLCAPARAAVKPAPRRPYPPSLLARIQDVTEAAISPDGGRIAYVSDKSGALEVWEKSLKTGRARRLTNLRQQAVDVHYSPDGKSIVFTSDFGGNERPNIYMVPSGGGKLVDVFRSTQAETSPRFSPDGRRLAYLSDPGEPFLFQLSVMDLKTGRRRQLTPGTTSLESPVWSPDGRTIAVVRTGDEETGDLILVDARTGKLRAASDPVPGGYLVPQAFSPSGQSLLCLARNKNGFMQLYLLSVKSLKGRFLGQDDWDVAQAAYNRRLGIVYTLNQAGIFALYRMKAPGANPRTLWPAGGYMPEFGVDAAGDKIACLWSDSTRASDVWILDPAAGCRTQATRSMPTGVKPESLSRQRPVSYHSFDGRLIRGFFLPPKTARLGRPPPLVVYVHGGPDWQNFDDFDPMRQALAEAGFAVLSPNFRGSTGFGLPFQRADYKDWGGADRRDIIWGVRFLAKKGDVDVRRVGIMGGSFGGYMTLYALARNTGLWKAGVDAYGMPDLTLDYNLTKDRFGDWYAAQMGTPQKDPALYKERSAVSYLSNMTAPVLIFQGANDTDVPPQESVLIYRKLKRLGRNVRLVLYPKEGHGLNIENQLFTRLKDRVDCYRKTIAFFTRALAAPGR